MKPHDLSSARELSSLRAKNDSCRVDVPTSAWIAAFELASEPMVFVHAGALDVMAVNPAFTSWLGRPPEDVVGASIERLGEELLGSSFAAEFAKATLAEEPAAFRVVTRGGEAIEVAVRRAESAPGDPAQVLVMALRLPSPAPATTAGSPAESDSLTGLANRTRLFRVGRQWLAQPGQTCALLFLDLDGFKQINDQFGHLAGDFVLQATATRLHSCVRPHDFVARYAGDEFVVLLSHVGGPQELERICERVEQSVSAPVMWAEKAVPVGVSVGAALAAADQHDFSALLHSADLAMYAHKAARKQTGMNRVD